MAVDIREFLPYGYRREGADGSIIMDVVDDSGDVVVAELDPEDVEAAHRQVRELAKRAIPSGTLEASSDARDNAFYCADCCNYVEKSCRHVSVGVGKGRKHRIKHLY